MVIYNTSGSGIIIDNAFFIRQLLILFQLIIEVTLIIYEEVKRRKLSVHYIIIYQVEHDCILL